MAGLVLVNPSSGPDDASLDDLRAAFPGAEVRACDPAELRDEVRAAIGGGVDFVGVAGGDGTIRCAAAVLAGTGVALLPIPEGTRNHFAHDVGIHDLDAAAAAAATGVTKRVDTALVNGEVFVNNSSIGLYPRMVRVREANEHRLPKRVAQLVAAWHQIRRGIPLVAEVDGRRVRAWVVFVGNGTYGEGVFDLTGRETLDGGTLDLCVVRADRPLARLRTAGAALAGRLSRSPLVERSSVTACTVMLDRPNADVALDGEIERLAPPLRYESSPGSLVVLAPAT
jgi:diacylglycerol kinase family enzyme